MTCPDDWWDAQQVDGPLELPFDDDGEFGDFLSPTWWRRPWAVYKDAVHAETLPDISLWEPAA